MRRIDDIEVLRGIGVVFVVFQHIGSLFPSKLPFLGNINLYVGGAFGVDLFFAVSGFVIARNLIPRLLDVQNKEKIVNILLAFWVRRIWRLWPTAWVWLFIILIAVVFFNQSGVYGTFEANLEATYAGIFHYANIRFANNFGLKEIGASFVFWSLSLEEQFYLLFPIIIILFKKRILLVFFLIAFIQMLLPRDNIYSIIFRTDALSLGVLIAIWSTKRSWMSTYKIFKYIGLYGNLLVSTIAIAVMALLSGVMYFNPKWIGVIALLSGLLVLMASYDSNFIFPKSCVKSIFVWIGERSYSIYVIHIPVFYATREIFYRFFAEQNSGIILNSSHFLVAMLMLIILVELNFRLLEMPLRNKGIARSNKILKLS